MTDPFASGASSQRDLGGECVIMPDRKSNQIPGRDQEKTLFSQWKAEGPFRAGLNGADGRVFFVLPNEADGSARALAGRESAASFNLFLGGIPNA